MVKRPFFYKSIEDLEMVFKSSKSDMKILEKLIYELRFRKTGRAKQLLSEIIKISNIEDGYLKNSSIFNDISMTKEPPIDNNNNNFYDSNKDQESFFAFDDTNHVCDPQKNRKNLRTNLGNSDIPSAEAIITAWLTLEILTPHSLPSKDDLRTMGRQLVNLADVPDPWSDIRYNKCGKEKGIYWIVYLGEINLVSVIESIYKMFPDEMSDERTKIRGNTTAVALIINDQGQLVTDKTFLSSFAWGYGKVRAGQIKELATFTAVETAITTEIEKQLIRKDQNGEDKPITLSDLEELTDWIIKEINLPYNEVQRPISAVRVAQYGQFKEDPEPVLLNSFFIEDLDRVRSEFTKEHIGECLSAYMRGYSKHTYEDIVKDKILLAKTLAPARFPLTRWPSPKRFPLVLMQQAAINHATMELKEEGLIAINGPPGTGKTTLLRDIIAKVVLDRAIAMSKFEKPDSAFTHITTIRTGNAYSHLYQLDKSLLGHEIVVASSNNKAVENISREIPDLASIANDFSPPLRYFKTISDAVAAGEKNMVEDSTWGISAAILGNAKNRNTFMKSFWWDKEKGMASYLGAIINENGTSPVPEVVELENPPGNEIEAFERWKLARKDFLEKLKKVEVLRSEAQDFYNAVQQKNIVIKKASEIEQLLLNTRKEIIIAEENLQNAHLIYERLCKTEIKVAEDRATIDRMRPGFFSRLFQTRAYRDWYQHMMDVVNEINKIRGEIKSALTAIEIGKETYDSTQKRLTYAEIEKTKADQEVKATLNMILAGQKRIGENFADESFWQQDDTNLQATSPWIFPELQKARDELFVASFGLHRAFIDGSARIMRHNIRAALEVLKGRTLNEKQEPVRRSLWASLFIVVPVISTTFASTSKLFGKLGKEQLGWLLIDEAGQATPQAALGALWRAKRAIVIGDPLQIEPVISVPPKLLNAIFSQFGVEKEEWSAPDVSAQILADRSCWFGTKITSQDGEIRIGAPLRVHRRCYQPMFSISNYIAYNGLMVYGTPDGNSIIEKVLGSSNWINVSVSENESGKWSRDEGIIVMDMLEKLLNDGILNPDIFFITPFRIVAAELKEMIHKNPRIANKLSIPAREWTNARVGTVHTFQGREADTVVLVLGASHDSCSGARRWAGASPNLLNVAVTRAKRLLYVVGDYNAWKNEGYFRYLARSLSKSKIN